MFKKVYRYVCLPASTLRSIRSLVRHSSSMSLAQRDEILLQLNNTQEVRPVPEPPKEKPKALLPWLAVFNSYLSRYGEAQTALMFGLPERVIRCITEGSCIPSERVQMQILVHYAKDVGLSYAEVANGKLKD